MIRNLKVLIVAATALAAFGALSATAHAAEEKFHCSVEPCRTTVAPDETAGTTTAHHVLAIKGKTGGGSEVSVSLTCTQLTGEGTSSTKTATELTLTNLKYQNSASEDKCKIGASETVTVDFTSCDYRLKSTNGSKSTAEVHVLCTTPGDGIDIFVGGVLCLRFTPFTSTGLGYHAGPLISGKKTVTATANSIVVPAASVMLENSEIATCKTVTGGMVAILSATLLTGNSLVKAETDPGGVAAEGWFE